MDGKTAAETSSDRTSFPGKRERKRHWDVQRFFYELGSISQIRIILLLQPANSPDTDANDAAFYRSLEYVLGETRQQRPVEVTHDFLLQSGQPSRTMMQPPWVEFLTPRRSTFRPFWEPRETTTMRARITGTSCRLEPTSGGTDRDQVPLELWPKFCGSPSAVPTIIRI